ncbi:hypothetical protein N7G274_003787 [Stereocaulon virgatum]|uniref:BTB domain-containing protein n=1 Tax=Stereocaulon virgatum TaxID=373712 RepID=A0ABR4ADA0_9LECA
MLMVSMASYLLGSPSVVPSGTAGNEATTPPLPPLLLLCTRMSLRSATKKLNMSLALSGPLSNARINLQVGERCFTTLASTLSEGSSFFASLLSGRWEDSQSADGSFFIDADPDLFAHILRYLRRGVLPVVYEKGHGFDHAFYKALQEEA